VGHPTLLLRVPLWLLLALPAQPELWVLVLVVPLRALLVPALLARPEMEPARRPEPRPVLRREAETVTRKTTTQLRARGPS